MVLSYNIILTKEGIFGTCEYNLINDKAIENWYLH